MHWSEWFLLAVVVTVSLVIWMGDAEARPDACQDWANTVEKLEQLDHQTRDAVIDGMFRLRGHHRYQTLMKAVMWVRSGQSSEQAWRQCESY